MPTTYTAVSPRRSIRQERVVQQDSNDVAGDTPTRTVEVGTRGSDVVGNKVMNAVSPITAVSLCLSEFESPGFLSMYLSHQASFSRLYIYQVKLAVREEDYKIR